jgi:hypothetical protein
MSVFNRVPLNAKQLRTVADRRYDDADYLRASGRNKHANGVLYLGGFVLECLLKARLLETFPQLILPPRPGDARAMKRYDLLWRHDLAAIVEELPNLVQRLNDLGAGGHFALTLRSLCGRWTIFARYSPKSATMQEADLFLDQIKDLKPWL